MSKTTELMLSPDGMNSIMKFAEQMSKSGDMIPKHWRGNQGACMALLTQAMRWNMDPYAVASQAFSISGSLGYSAQLVNSVISTSSAIVGRFHYEYSEGWEALAGKASIQKVEKSGQNGKYSVEIPVAGWSADDEAGLWVKAGAQISGESEITWGEKVYLSGVLVRNSPLWVTKPDQQIGYLAIKYWSRLYCPAVIMGVYTSDELQDIPPVEKEVSGTTIKEMNQKAKTEELPALDNFEDETPDGPEPEKKESRALAKTDVVLQDIAKAKTMQALRDIQKYAKNVSSDDLDMVMQAYNEKVAELKAAKPDSDQS